MLGRAAPDLRDHGGRRERLDQFALTEVTEGIKAPIVGLTAAIAGLTPTIKLAIAALRGAVKRERLMRFTPGVGPNTAAVLLGDMPGLGTLAQGEIAGFAGLAPHPQAMDRRHLRRAKTRPRRALHGRDNRRVQKPDPVHPDLQRPEGRRKTPKLARVVIM